MTSWIDGVDNTCDCATAAPIVLDNLLRVEEGRPLLNQSDPARGYSKVANGPPLRFDVYRTFWKTTFPFVVAVRRHSSPIRKGQKIGMSEAESRFAHLTPLISIHGGNPIC